MQESDLILSLPSIRIDRDKTVGQYTIKPLLPASSAFSIIPDCKRRHRAKWQFLVVPLNLIVRPDPVGDDFFHIPDAVEGADFIQQFFFKRFVLPESATNGLIV